MSDRTELLAAWRQHTKTKGSGSAEAIIATFCGNTDEPAVADVPDEKIDEAIAALRKGVPTSARTSPKTMADLDTTAIWNRFNAAGNRPKPTAT